MRSAIDAHRFHEWRVATWSLDGVWHEMPHVVSGHRAQSCSSAHRERTDRLILAGLLSRVVRRLPKAELGVLVLVLYCTSTRRLTGVERNDSAAAQIMSFL